MTLDQLLALAGANPLATLILGAVLPLLLARLGVKLPLAPKPTPGPGPSPAPTPGPTGRPLLDAILKLLLGGGSKAVADVTTDDLLKARAELNAQLAERAKQADAIRAALAPEPTRPL